MTLKHNKTKGERFEALEKRVQNMEMASRITQMLVQQIGNSVSPMARDVGELAGRQREIQYRLLAIQELLGLNIDQINARSEELQVKDFEETSAKEDVEKGLNSADVVTEDSIVIFTSKTPDEEVDRGILRSKLLVKEIGFPALREDLIGKKVGDTLLTDVNGVKHSITILGVRAAAPLAQSASTDGQTQ
jgi:hypothetical protein